ncbi:hypothetical protein OY671_008330, partial [Metschnikowia pulcherrima]
VRESGGADVASARDHFRDFAGVVRAQEGSIGGIDHDTVDYHFHEPSGVVGQIIPWNFPLSMAAWKMAPASAAGNTVISKPAEWSPLSASVSADSIEQAGSPPGVVNIVQGFGRDSGMASVSDPRVKRISFTGSVPTARVIGRAAAENIVPFTAELGGKSPSSVFADADIDAAAKKAAGQYDDSGQVCMAGTRIIVEESVREPFLERFHAYADTHVSGDSRDPATTMSASIHPDHVARVMGFIDRARAAGDTIVRGGKSWREGANFIEPTSIVPRSNDSEVVQNEVFGPVS